MFYRHFPANDALVVAWIAETEAKAPLVPMDGTAPLTDTAMTMIAIAGGPTSLGSAFQGTAADFSDPDHPPHQAG